MPEIFIVYLVHVLCWWGFFGLILLLYRRAHDRHRYHQIAHKSLYHSIAERIVQKQKIDQVSVQSLYLPDPKKYDRNH